MIDTSRPLVTAVAVFGDVTVIVPDGVVVELEGVAVFGQKRCTAGGGPVVPGAPVVQVRALAAFGDVRVRAPRADRPRRRGARQASSAR